MGFNLNKEIEKLTSSVTAKAKDSAISTLKDPQFKATVNQFTKEWFQENSHIIIPIVFSFLALSVLATANIISNFKVRR